MATLPSWPRDTETHSVSSLFLSHGPRIFDPTSFSPGLRGHGNEMWGHSLPETPFCLCVCPDLAVALLGWLVSIAPQLKAFWGWSQESCRVILGRRHLWMGAQIALEVAIRQNLKGEHVV